MKRSGMPVGKFELNPQGENNLGVTRTYLTPK